MTEFEYPHISNTFTLPAIIMTRLLILILVLSLKMNLKAQEFDRNTILKYKIKEIQKNIQADSTFVIDSVVVTKYNEQGMLIEERRNASAIYPINTLSVTSYFYEDTTLLKEVQNKWLNKKLIATDTIYYYYDSLRRLEFIYNPGHHLVFETLERFEYYSDTKDILKISHYSKDSPTRGKDFQDLLPMPAICPYTFTNGVQFYLDFFEMYTPGRTRIENKKLKYWRCTNDTSDCHFCLSGSEISLNFGDTLNEKIVFENTVSYSELEGSRFTCDSTGWFVPAIGIHSITTEKYFNGKIMERHVRNVELNRRDLDGEGDVYYFYDSQDLLVKTKKNWTIDDLQLIKYVLTVTYNYKFYE